MTDPELQERIAQWEEEAENLEDELENAQTQLSRLYALQDSRRKRRMTTETILTDNQICKTLIDAGILLVPQEITGYDIEIARAIEQAVLQSEQVQAWKRDSERMEWYFGSADKTSWVPEYMRGCTEGWSVEQWLMSIDAAMARQQK